MALPVIVSNPEVNLTISEASDHLVISGPSAFSATYAQFFTQVGGKIAETSATHVNWQLPKSFPVAQMLTAMLGYDITSKYTVSVPEAPPKPSGPLTVAGMSFAAPLGATPGIGGFPGVLPLPTPTAAGGMPLPGFPSTGLPGGLPVSGMPSVVAGPPVSDRQPSRLIVGNETEQRWIYDYTAASIAVFIGRILYEQGGNKLLEQAGGKSSSLYPDGSSGGQRRGWIFAKSNKGAMDYLSQWIGQDIRTLCDFSQVRTRGRRDDPPPPTAAYVPHALGPQMVSGPFPQGLASIPGIPEPGAVLSGTDLLTKAFRDFVATVKTSSPGTYIISTPEKVALQLKPDSVVEFEFELGGFKCVKLSS